MLTEHHGSFVLRQCMNYICRVTTYHLECHDYLLSTGGLRFICLEVRCRNYRRIFALESLNVTFI